MNSEIQPHELNKLGVLIAQHGGEIPAPVLGGVDRTGGGPVPIQVAVNDGSHCWQLGNQVHGIFIGHLRQTNKPVTF